MKVSGRRYDQRSSAEQCRTGFNIRNLVLLTYGTSSLRICGVCANPHPCAHLGRICSSWFFRIVFTCVSFVWVVVEELNVI
ncbi:hypothetical protein ARMGADRAFT_550045 [Armillaria gallica]|uniref:Uncharacterized protein n=1 Tax=Armillaria gallica TaxID=47427 RepID=A0A2H3CV12_ARMGA|nr:hypothetical protein ARMGADRAFT_550045 [Armillaria gallica]